MATNPFWRRLQLGLPTLLGLARKGYFIPYRYADSIPESAAREGYPWVATLFSNAEPEFLKLLEDTDRVADIAARFSGATPPSPRWQQSWFPRLDGLAAYAMVARYKPAQIVEVGSGHSTRFIAAAVRDLTLATRITAIDPAPRADIASLPDITIHRATVQSVDRAVFSDLGPGDFLMIDSSHIHMPGSDVDILIGRALPTLPKGVFVQIHDILLPDAYPAQWDWRGYNEVAPVLGLLAGAGFRPVWSSRWIATRRADLLATVPLSDIPLEDGAVETALWLEKTCDAVPGR